MTPESRIFVAGHLGMVGSAILRLLKSRGYHNLVVAPRASLDLRDQQSVDAFFAGQKIDYVFLAAAKVGGILANSQAPAEFLRDNLAIEANVIHAAWKNGVQKLEFLGSSCIYPKFAPQPIREDSLLTGALEPTNQWYAIAKIAGLKLVEAYREQYGFRGISLMPTNLYGPGDNFDLETSHVLPALIRKCHDAKIAGASTVTVWGSGLPRREFLHVDDLAEAAVHLMETYDLPEIVNVGTGEDISIRELVELVARVVGFKGGLHFDTSKPDGTPRKLLDVSRAHNTGWRAKIGLEDGIASTYESYFKAKAAEVSLAG